MNLSVTQKIKLKITRQFLTAGIALGCIYIYFYFGFTDLTKYITGAVVGVILALILSFFELYVFARGAKKIKFLWLLFLRTLIYLFSITFVIFYIAALVRAIKCDSRYLEVISDPRS